MGIVKDTSKRYEMNTLKNARYIQRFDLNNSDYVCKSDKSSSDSSTNTLDQICKLLKRKKPRKTHYKNDNKKVFPKVVNNIKYNFCTFKDLFLLCSRNRSKLHTKHVNSVNNDKVIPFEIDSDSDSFKSSDISNESYSPIKRQLKHVKYEHYFLRNLLFRKQLNSLGL